MSEKRDEFIISLMTKVNSVIPLDSEAIIAQSDLLNLMPDDDRKIHIGKAMFYAENLPMIIGSLCYDVNFAKYFIGTCMKQMIAQGALMDAVGDDPYKKAKCNDIRRMRDNMKAELKGDDPKLWAVVGKTEYEPEVYERLIEVMDDSWSHFDTEGFAKSMQSKPDELLSWFSTLMSNYAIPMMVIINDDYLMAMLDQINWRAKANIS